jgi:hypothetical protein
MSSLSASTSRLLSKQLLPTNKASLKVNCHHRLLQSSTSRLFASSAASMVKAGDSIPAVHLYENSPGNSVDLAKELKGGKGLIIGVPAAFSM